MGTYTVTKNNEGHYFVTLKAKDGRIILNSQKHLSKESCKSGIETIRTNATDNLKYEYKKTFDGKFYFRLKSVNGDILGQSKIFESAKHRDGEIEMVRKIAPVALIFEQ